MSTELVPGDVICIPTNSRAQLIECDAVILSGSCVMNEAILTGESAAQLKYSLHPAMNGETGEAAELQSSMSADQAKEIKYDPDDASFQIHTLFAGTELLQARTDKINGDTRDITSNHVIALVIRTGMHFLLGCSIARNIFGVEADPFERFHEL